MERAVRGEELHLLVKFHLPYLQMEMDSSVLLTCRGYFRWCMGSDQENQKLKASVL